MVTRTFSSRVFALAAAYALALQALLLSMTPVAPITIDAGATIAVLCTAVPGTGQPAGQDHPPCAPDCLMAGCMHGAAAPPLAAIAANIAPSEIRMTQLVPFETPGRAIAKTPQVPRAPPLA